MRARRVRKARRLLSRAFTPIRVAAPPNRDLRHETVNIGHHYESPRRWPSCRQTQEEGTMRVSLPGKKIAELSSVDINRRRTSFIICPTRRRWCETEHFDDGAVFPNRAVHTYICPPATRTPRVAVKAGVSCRGATRKPRLLRRDGTLSAKVNRCALQAKPLLGCTGHSWYRDDYAGHGGRRH